MYVHAVGISLKRSDQEAVLLEALDLARDTSIDLPADWTKRTEIVGGCPAKTYIAVFGAALLGKATDPNVDAMTFQYKAQPNAFNARNPAKLMWEYARRHRFDFGGTGDDPHQSRPFTNRPRVDDIPIDTVEHPRCLEQLVVFLRDLNACDKRAAIVALAAYLRVRTAIYEEKSRGTSVVASASGIGLLALATVVQSFIRADPEDGGRGQAAVAAAFNAAGRSAQTKRPNDPQPIDVKVTDGGALFLGSEVKQKPVTDLSADDLATRVRKLGGDRALLCALADKQRPLDRETIRRDAEKQGVIGLLAESVIEVFEVALAAGTASREEFLTSFPPAMAQALEAVNAGIDGRRYWAVVSEGWSSRGP